VALCEQRWRQWRSGGEFVWGEERGVLVINGLELTWEGGEATGLR
jgi:hypothetical protein